MNVSNQKNTMDKITATNYLGNQVNVSVQDENLKIFKTITDDILINVNNNKSLVLVLGELSNDVRGYNLYQNGKLIHQNHTGDVVLNDFMKEMIKEGVDPFTEDAFQWIEKNIGAIDAFNNNLK